VEQQRKWVHFQKVCWSNWEKGNQTGHSIQNQSACVQCSSWSFKKDGKKGLPGSNSVWHSIRSWHWSNCSFRWRFDLRRDTWRWLLCTGRVSEDHSGVYRIRCAKCFRWAHTHCAGMEEYFVCEMCRINRLTVWFIVYILCICNCLYFVTILCALCANYSPPQIRNTCAPK
jgi:hypothetical protein